MRLILATYATTFLVYMTAGKLSIEIFKIYSYFFQTALSAVMVKIIGQPFDDAFGKILLLLFRIEGRSSVGLEMKPNSKRTAGILVWSST